MRGRRWIAALAIVAAIGAACSGSDGGGEGGGAGDGAQNAMEAPVPQPAGVRVQTEADLDEAFSAQSYDEGATLTTSGGGGGDAGTTGSSAANLPATGPNVIKTARVEVEVKADTFQDALDDANDIARVYGGFVLASQTDGADSKRGRIIIRVPSVDFLRALSDARALGKVTGEEVSGQDVSQEFVDLEARLRNYTAQEAVLLRLMDRAQSVADTIRVQRELEDIQLEIERLRGRLRYLEDQTAFGTIAIQLREAGVVVSRPGALRKAWNNAIDVFMGVVAAVIVGAGFVVPIGLMLLVLALVLRALMPSTFGRSPRPGASETTV